MSEDNDRWGSVEEGIELLAIGERDAAILELLRVAEAEPDNEYAHFFLGNAYFEGGTFDAALKCYVRALALAADYIGAMIGAGQALRMMGEHGRALRMGREVLARRKDDPDALFLLGAVHFQRGEGAAAKGFLERFLKTDPEVEVALEVEGMLQVLRGEVHSLPQDGNDPPN